MLLSIFNFKKPNPTHAIMLLLTTIFLYASILELVTRVGFSRISSTQHRIHEDYQAAILLQPTALDKRRSILIVGNSLLLFGVNRAKFIEEMAPKYHVVLLPIENTVYLDWYFGLRRLFAEGSRPEVVIVCLNIQQLISHSTNGEYFAHYMMRTSDIFNVKKIARLDTTKTSNFFFANVSSWIGSRSQIRNWLLEKLMPSFETLAGYLPNRASAILSTDDVVKQALLNLKDLQELVINNGARFIFLIPPQANSDNHNVTALIKSLAAQDGITIVTPYIPGEMPANVFKDGFHLNPYGADLFTERLWPILIQTLLQNL